MKNTVNFYNWFISLGGEVKFLNVDNIFKTLNNVNLKIFTFKNDLQRVKEMYNYKFKTSD